MDHPGFFDNAGPFPVKAIADLIKAEIAPAERADDLLVDIKPLDRAGPQHLSFIDNPKYLPQFATTLAGACILAPLHAERQTTAGVRLISDDPYRAFALALALFYPTASRPAVFSDLEGGVSSLIHPEAIIEVGAIIEPGAVIGKEARIGRGTRVAPGAVIGRRSYIGRHCSIGANANILHAIVGDNVIIHQGASIGQDGFGFAMGTQGHLKVPQIGRVIIQNDVEIGANTTIDRGALGDTIIGEGTKIDNLVQIGHNVVIGRHCVIVSQVGVSGSTHIDDFVIFGGQGASVGHVHIGAGARIAANGKVTKDVAPGATLAGAPAVPIRQWKREIAALRRLAEEKKR